MTLCLLKRFVGRRGGGVEEQNRHETAIKIIKRDQIMVECT